MSRGGSVKNSADRCIGAGTGQPLLFLPLYTCLHGISPEHAECHSDQECIGPELQKVQECICPCKQSVRLDFPAIHEFYSLNNTGSQFVIGLKWTLKRSKLLLTALTLGSLTTESPDVLSCAQLVQLLTTSFNYFTNVGPSVENIVAQISRSTAPALRNRNNWQKFYLFTSQLYHLLDQWNKGCWKKNVIRSKLKSGFFTRTICPRRLSF